MAESLFNLPFGKYKSQPVEDVPTFYLHWLTEQDWFCDNHRQGLEAVNTEIAFREKFGGNREPDEDRDWNRRNK